MMPRMSATASRDASNMRLARSWPIAPFRRCMPQGKPMIICPPLRPDAPQPTRLASTMATRLPALASSIALYRPKKPAPTTQTSTSRFSCSDGRFDCR
jgi:hypothetical protein